MRRIIDSPLIPVFPRELGIFKSALITFPFVPSHCPSLAASPNLLALPYA